MKKIAILAALLASSPAWAQTPTGGTEQEGNFDPNETVCQPVAQTGSRLSRARVCMSRAQWAEQRRLTRQNTERVQANRGERQY